MTEYAPGMRLIIRDEEWIVKNVETNVLGNKALHCIGISSLVKDKPSIFLADLEKIEIVDPSKIHFIPDTSPHFGKSLLYWESLWRQQLPTNKNITIGHKAAMDLMPYQLEPTNLALQYPRQRILIADAVGLGKTLEAGILISELIKRGKGKRILVVTVKSMMTQFQKEMWNRFTIPLVRLDSKKIQKIRTSLPTNYNPFFYYDKTIISVDTLKRDIEYRTHLENAYWDIIVIDEAQNVAERGKHQAQRAKLAKLLSSRSDTMIMLSATPHDGRAKSFASLMNMLDPTAIADPEHYTPDDIKGLCIRRFKNDIKNQVDGAFLEREVHIEKAKASPAEEHAFNIFANLNLVMDQNKKKGAGELFKTSLEKSLFSSPAACISSIDHRLKKLKKKYNNDSFEDIPALEELKDALNSIKPTDFSRYQKLIGLLKSNQYNWKPTQKDDRLVIFTERIETMKFLAHQLAKDLNLKSSAVQEISGAMSDEEQQTIVENFSRTESPIRILVASDVASEGLNLHYLCHRLIHFDIPWSLMVFQQRNGRIDRYGQQYRPDIRYMMIESDNPRIKGDLRIMNILIEKEDQARENIGDPAMLLRKFSIEEEEKTISGIIETGAEESSFNNLFADMEDDFDPLEALMQSFNNSDSAIQNTTKNILDNETLFTDKEYLEKGISILNSNIPTPIKELKTVSGLDIKLTEDMRRRLSATMPEEAMPANDILRLSDDKKFCMEEMKKSMQNNLENTAWPTTQYLWALHPIINWLNDKANLLFDRGTAPYIDLENILDENESIYIVQGSIPNRKSTSLVDEWFGIHFKNEKFIDYMNMNDIIQKTKIRTPLIANTNKVDKSSINKAEALLPQVIELSKNRMKFFYDSYVNEMTPRIDEELDKLIALQEKHKDYYQLLLFDNKRELSKQERRVDELFDNFSNWVTDTLTIQNNPYIHIVAIISGVHA